MQSSSEDNMKRRAPHRKSACKPLQQAFTMWWIRENDDYRYISTEDSLDPIVGFDFLLFFAFFFFFFLFRTSSPPRGSSARVPACNRYAHRILI